jgi:hypothetical protein
VVVDTPATVEPRQAAIPSPAEQQLGQNTGEQKTQVQQQSNQYIFSVSTGWSPALYWLGDYKNGTFTPAKALEAACLPSLTSAAAAPAAAGVREEAVTAAPTPLDLGDLLYAPNVLKDANVRIAGFGYG